MILSLWHTLIETVFESPPSLALAAQRIKRLEEENARLKSENSRLLEHYILWQYNAYRNGLAEVRLNAALPMISRESKHD